MVDYLPFVNGDTPKYDRNIWDSTLTSLLQMKESTYIVKACRIKANSLITIWNMLVESPITLKPGSTFPVAYVPDPSEVSFVRVTGASRTRESVYISNMGPMVLSPISLTEIFKYKQGQCPQTSFRS